MISKVTLLDAVDSYRDRMVDEMINMLQIPAMAPESGGQGEMERIRHLETVVRKMGFKDVQRIDTPDPRVKSGIRPNLIVRIVGERPETVWMVAHTDTVSPGDESAWTKTRPFEPRLMEGKIYGRGSEDNGQAVISCLFAAKVMLDIGIRPERSIGLALVADEEVGSSYGVKHLLKEKSIFKKGDIIYVPDAGSPDGFQIEVGEKSSIWLKFTVKGKQVHASTPDLGINAQLVGSRFMLNLREILTSRFGGIDDFFTSKINI